MNREQNPESKLEQAAVNYVTELHNKQAGENWYDQDEAEKQSFLSGAKSEAAKEYWQSLTTPASNEVEEGQTQEPVGGMKEMETFERMKKIQIWADEDSSKFQNACRDLGFDATDGAISGRSGGYTQAIKDIFSNPTKFGLTPPPAPVGIDVEGLIDEIYEIDDIDTLREMLIKAKQSSKQWCQKAIEAARDRQQLSEHNKAIIKDLKETREQLADSQSSTSERTVNDIIHCSCILLGIDDKECSVCYPSSTEEENLFVEWVGQTFVRMHGGWLYRYENQINPDLKTTNQLREKWEEIKRLSGRQ